MTFVAPIHKRTTVSLHSRTGQRGSALINLLVLLLVAAAVAGGWYGWQYQQAQQRAQARTGETLVQLQQQQESQQGSLGEATRQLQERLDEVEARQQESLALINEMASGGQRNWLLNEAESLASLAQERLLLTGDLTAARRLLEAADTTLTRLQNPDILPARRALRADIQRLDTAQQMDTNGLVLRLGALIDQLDEQVSAGVTARADAFALRRQAEDPVSAQASWWQQFLDALPVRLQQMDAPASAPLTIDQAQLVRLQLQAALQQAQLAAMQSCADVYRQSLAQAQALALQWLDPARGQVWTDNVKALALVPVEQAMPEIGAGLAAIRNLQQAGEKAQKPAAKVSSPVETAQ